MADAKFINDDVDLFEGDMVIDPDPLAQSISFRLSTRKGGHFFYPNYGRTTKLIGVMMTPHAISKIMDDLYDICVQDPRISTATIRLKQYHEGLFACIKAGEREEFEVQI